MRKRPDQLNSKSHERIRAATLHLLDDRSPEKITVTDIVGVAGLTRPTFYAVFPDLSSAFADAALSRLVWAFEGTALTGDLPEADRADAMETAFGRILQRIDSHADFFSRVLRGPGGMQVYDRLVEFLAARLREKSPLSATLAQGLLPTDVTSGAVAAGVAWTILRWLDSEPREPSATLAQLIRDLILQAMLGGLGRASVIDHEWEPRP